MDDHTERAIKQMRNASANLDRADQFSDGQVSGAVPPMARLLAVLADSIEFWGASNRGQVEGALADYFDFLDGDPDW